MVFYPLRRGSHSEVWEIWGFPVGNKGGTCGAETWKACQLIVLCVLVNMEDSVSFQIRILNLLWDLEGREVNPILRAAHLPTLASEEEFGA